MRPVETIPGMGGEGIKEKDRGGEFNSNILQELLQKSQCVPNITTIK
jgi:hypothetical protein